MSQLNTILERIADIQVTINVPGLGIPWVLTAEPYQPDKVVSDNLPAFVNEIYGGPSDLPISDGAQHRNTNVRMLLLVARRTANIDLKYTVETTAAWADAVYAAFAGHIKLSAPQVNVLSSTNTSPIIVTTGTNHCLNPAGDQVTIAGHTLNTTANGNWNATIIDNKTFSIPAAGIAVGGPTGTARMIQPGDLNGFLTKAIITSWNVIDYDYGSTKFIALQFVLSISELYLQPTAI